jgi:hypothetical protein
MAALDGDVHAPAGAAITDVDDGGVVQIVRSTVICRLCRRPRVGQFGGAGVIDPIE